MIAQPLTDPDDGSKIVAAWRDHSTALIGYPRKLIDIPAYGAELRDRALQLQ